MTNPSDETAEELSARAIKTNRGEWTPFDDLFYHGCCDCGLSHAVRIRRIDDGGHENQWTFHAALTDQTRKSGRHPLWDEVQQLRGNLSLAEEGLANYALEVERLKAALRLLDNGFKHSAEVCNIARGALAQSSHELEKQS